MGISGRENRVVADVLDAAHLVRSTIPTNLTSRLRKPWAVLFVALPWVACGDRSLLGPGTAPELPAGGIYVIAFTFDESSESTAAEPEPLPEEAKGEYWVRLRVVYSTVEVPEDYESTTNPVIEVLDSRSPSALPHLTEDTVFPYISSWRDGKQAGWRMRLLGLDSLEAVSDYLFELQVIHLEGESNHRTTCQMMTGDDDASGAPTAPFLWWWATTCSATWVE